MKLFISADMEGVTGVTAWEDVTAGSKTYDYFREQMTREVLGVCDTAYEVAESKGEDISIMVKDAHDSARNLKAGSFKEGTILFSGWSRDPYVMMSGIDSSFDGVIFTGYHSGAYYSGSPLAHTMNSEKLVFFKINGVNVSEFVLNSYTAAYFNVPVIVITGDEMICAQAEKMIPDITAIPVKKGNGGGMVSLSNDEAIKLIKKSIKKALNGDFGKCIPELPKNFKCEICFKEHQLAYRASFYKGVKLKDSHTVEFETDDFFEVLRTYFFL